MYVVIITDLMYLNQIFKLSFFFIRYDYVNYCDSSLCSIQELYH